MTIGEQYRDRQGAASSVDVGRSLTVVVRLKRVYFAGTSMTRIDFQCPAWNLAKKPSPSTMM